MQSGKISSYFRKRCSFAALLHLQQCLKSGSDVVLLASPKCSFSDLFVRVKNVRVAGFFPVDSATTRTSFKATVTIKLLVTYFVKHVCTGWLGTNIAYGFPMHSLNLSHCVMSNEEKARCSVGRSQCQSLKNKQTTHQRSNNYVPFFLTYFSQTITSFSVLCGIWPSAVGGFYS